MLHGAKRCGRAGPAVRCFAAHDRLTALRGLGEGPLSLRLRRVGRDGRTMLHGAKRCGRAGPAVRCFATHDRLTALAGFGGTPVSPRFRCGGRDSRTILRCTR
jgi:hypothetical protein